VNKVSEFFDANFRVIVALALVALILLAWSNRFIQDDAFISFRYADNFARGHGLVWNEGERVEGYTNFLWTLLISLPLRFGYDPIKFSYALGLTCFALSLIFTLALAQTLLRSKAYALLSVVLLGTNYTFSSYATGGMETQMQACLFAITIWLLFRCMNKSVWSVGAMLCLSMLLALAVLTRPDSILLVIVVLPVAMFFLFSAERNASQKIIRVGALIVPFALIVGAWLRWKISYYGDVLPNTYYVKLGSQTSLRYGFMYVCSFFESYWLVLFPLLFLIIAPKLFKKSNFALLVVSIFIVLWFAYTIKAGGDFMEFRFLVPVLPLLFILIVWLMTYIRSRTLQAALITLVLFGSLNHALTFDAVSLPEGIESIEFLGSHLESKSANWVGIGKLFGEVFAGDPRVTIAVAPAGAIPYYSRLQTIDILGLNDKWIARNGDLTGTRPGHQRIAPLHYLIERGVNVLIGHPYIFDRASAASAADLHRGRRFFSWFKPGDELPIGSKLIEIPLDATHALLAIYLVQNPRVDEAINSHHWHTYMLERDGTLQTNEYPLYKTGTRIDSVAFDADKYLRAGWGERNTDGRWSVGRRATIIFASDNNQANVLRMRASPFLVPGKLNAQRLNVLLNGRVMATLRIDRAEPQDYAIALPRESLQGASTLVFEMPDAASPRSLGVNDDPRQLGIRVQWIEIGTQDKPPRDSPP